MRGSKDHQYNFLLNCEQIRSVACAFRHAMVDGLGGRGSPLKMLPSFLEPPKGELEGTYLAVDFGGSNIRALEVEFCNRAVHIAGFQKQELPKKTSAIELFDCVANLVKDVVSSATYLGHTFSFPCRQCDVNTAYLLAWTKEITTPGVEGEDINRLLNLALQKQGLAIHPVAIINDTVGTLLTGAYYFSGADIAAICGTGHNACYLEPAAPPYGKPMIINMESGNFDKLPYTAFDAALDRASDRPGQQLLEKMVAGRYLGELARLVIIEFISQGELPVDNKVFNTSYALLAEDIANWVEAGSPRPWLKARGVESWTDLQCRMIVQICKDIILRSAQLVAATFLGVLQHIDPANERTHVIAVDGSLYEKAPGYAAQIELVLREALGDRRGSVEVKLVKDGSGIGAAIAAAIASEEVG